MTTQQPFEKVTEFYQSFSQPVQEFTALNVKTVNAFSQNSESLNSLIKASSPQEFFNAQMKLSLKAGQQAVDYFQETLKIFEKTSTDLFKQYGEKKQGSTK